MVEVERTNERCIFLIQNNNLNYYVIVPMAKQVKMLLCLMEKDDVQRIKEIPVYNDMVVVVPIFSEQVINYLVTPKTSYDQAMNYFSALINNVYGLLSHNGKQVDQVVLLNNDEKFINFINYFVGKIPGRVKMSDTNYLVKETVKNNIMDNNIATTNEPPIKNEVPLVNPDDFHKENNQTPVTKNSEPGFVSYVLLGVVIAVVSLVLLYFII